jgi:2-amino-4-hydroxy-6-hydroxymethyldihydropteridine diphosphokinase
VLARIGIGANLGDPERTVRDAIVRLRGLGTIVRASSLYRTAPWGVEDQEEFVNAAVLLETQLEPRALLVELKRLEAELGRTPTFRWGPRVIDLDILAYEDRVIDETDLVIPHPRLRERAFALVPLAEIDPAFVAARDALPSRQRDGVVRID